MPLHCETIEDTRARYGAGREGRHFFDPSTLRFFRGRVATVAHTGGGASFFVTSEQFQPSRGPAHARMYSVRILYWDRPDHIATMYGHGAGFQRFATSAEATRAAKAAAAQAREADALALDWRELRLHVYRADVPGVGFIRADYSTGEESPVFDAYESRDGAAITARHCHKAATAAEALGVLRDRATVPGEVR